ncbi:MAG: xanthine dehydrogenase family protein subunit M [Armatimonadota bacterium]
MRPFSYERSLNPVMAAQKSLQGGVRLLAGGTNLLDLLKEGVEDATKLVDITRIPLAEIREENGGVRIGALAKNADTADNPLIRRQYPLLSQAILAGASAQIRNMATDGGNLMQRTRCPYFYDIAMPCNKRVPGTGCGAREGLNKMHALFGWSESCVAVHPSDMCVALAALDATVQVQGADGKERSIPFTDFHRLPGDQPQKDNTLQPGEVIVALVLPKPIFTDKSHYLKVRDRASYAFALVSVAAGLETKGGKVQQVRLAMGGVAHKPWRAVEAEKALVGKAPTEANFLLAAEAEMKNARPLEHNAFKVDLGKRAIVRALSRANGAA